jgi:lipoprotein-anchoring transpeptidase ErfK/SrfK
VSVLRTAVALVVAAGLACANAPAAKQTPAVPRGVTVLGVPVGGLTSEPARATIERAFAQPIAIAYRGKKIVVSPRRFGAGASVDAAVASALAATPGSRIGLPVTYSKRDVASFVRWLKRRYHRDPVDATVVGADARGPIIHDGKPGVAVREETMRIALVQVLRSGVRTPLQLVTRPLRPHRTRANFGPIIVITRGANTLQLYSSTKPWRTFRVATGRSEYPTPAGVWEIVDKQLNPWWRPPDSPWARGLKPIPPGPGNPLGTRWMGLSAPGVGIHGTPDAASVGYSASHGCIRMYVPDAEWLFNHVDYGTPVVIL